MSVHRGCGSGSHLDRPLAVPLPVVPVAMRDDVMQEVVPYVPGASAAGRPVTAPEPAVGGDGALEAARRVGGQHGAVVGQRAVNVQDLG